MLAGVKPHCISSNRLESIARVFTFQENKIRAEKTSAELSMDKKQLMIAIYVYTTA